MTEKGMAETIQARMDAIAFMKRTGAKVQAADNGYGKAMMPLAGNENHVGSMYIGALTTLAEAGAAISISTVLDFTKYFPIVKAMNIDFLKPAMTDVFAEYRLSAEQIAELDMELKQNSHCEYIADLPLKDKSGETVASARVTIKVLSHRPPKE